MLILDVFGLPASGKTTARGNIQAALRQRRIVAWDREEALDRCLRRKDVGILKAGLKYLPRALREAWIGERFALEEWHAFAAGHVRLVHMLYGVLSGEGVTRAFRECCLYGFMQQGIRHEIFRRYLRDRECVLWDEGFLHRGFTLFGYLPAALIREEDIATYVRSIPMPGIAVWIRTKPDIAFRRIQDRLASGISLPVLLEPFPIRDRRGQIEHGWQCLERIAGYFAATGRPLFHSDADGNLGEQTLTAIAEKVEEHASRTGQKRAD